MRLWWRRRSPTARQHQRFFANSGHGSVPWDASSEPLFRALNRTLSDTPLSFAQFWTTVLSQTGSRPHLVPRRRTAPLRGMQEGPSSFPARAAQGARPCHAEVQRSNGLFGLTSSPPSETAQKSGTRSCVQLPTGRASIQTALRIFSFSVHMPFLWPFLLNGESVSCTIPEVDSKVRHHLTSGNQNRLPCGIDGDLIHQPTLDARGSTT